MDIFEMRKFANNAVSSHLLRIGVENERCEDFTIAIIENGKVVTQVNLYSELARKTICEALLAEIEFNEMQMKKIADGEEPEQPVRLPNEANAPF